MHDTYEPCIEARLSFFAGHFVNRAFVLDAPLKHDEGTI